MASENGIPLVEAYRERFQDRGLGGPQVGALSHTHCAESMETVRKRWAPRHLDYLRWVTGSLLPWAMESILPPGAEPPRMPTPDFESLAATGPVVAGSPQQVLDRLAGFKEAIGLDRQLFHVDQGALPQEELFESLELIATEVLPKL